MKREIEDRRGTAVPTKQNVHAHSSVLGHLIVYDLRSIRNVVVPFGLLNDEFL